MCLQIFLIGVKIGFEAKKPDIQAPHVKEKNLKTFSVFKGKTAEKLGSSKVPLHYCEKLYIFEYV